jgi:uncharacterized surface protein with fasciclin (FAS1) repeats
MKSNPLNSLALVIALGLSSPAVFAQATPAAEQDKKMVQPMIEPGSITAVVTDSLSFSTLKKALIAAGLDSTLGAKGAYTVFAPTDAAFDKLPAGVLGKLMLPENKEKLRMLLLFHVVAGKTLAADLKDGNVKTMNGEMLKIDVDAETVKVQDVKVSSADVTASNGVIHTIGMVLMPESMKDFSALEN